MLRVLIVDDSAFMRKALTRIISSDPELEVIDTARDGQDAVEKVKSLRPDVVTMDIEMPNMDGLTALERIMQIRPTPVLMCSSLTKSGSREALRALALGAMDFLAKDASHLSVKMDDLRDELITKIKAIGHRKPPKPAMSTPAHSDVKLDISPTRFDMTLIGSSTGGPPVLEDLLSRLPADVATPIVIAQHMPLLFTRSMAERLDAKCAVSVVHAENHMPLHPGVAYVIPGGSHGHVIKTISGRWIIQVNDQPVAAVYKPSVDALFSSGATHAGARCLGVVLTGMGADGLVGAKEIHAKGGMILAQSGDTCAVYGMPRAVTEAGIIAASLGPLGLAKQLQGLGLTKGAGPLGGGAGPAPEQAAAGAKPVLSKLRNAG